MATTMARSADGTPAGRRPIRLRPEEKPLEEVAAGRGTRMQVLLGDAESMPHFAMRRFVIEEGGGMPLHTNEVEHEQYVLAGAARVRVGDETLAVRAGDVVYIPARVPHEYDVVEGPFEFLCMVPNLPDTMRLVDE